jgi:hypothetical protein
VASWWWQGMENIRPGGGGGDGTCTYRMIAASGDEHG